MTSDPKRVHQPGDKAESSSGEVLQRHLLAENGLEDTVDTAFKPTKKDHSASVDQIAKTEILVEETGKEIDGKKATQAQETTEYQSDTDRPFSEAAFSVNQPTEAFQYTPGQPGSYRIKSNVASTTIPKFIGDYEIKRVLGRGGMGVVYLAHQRSLKRDVALKMVLEGQHASDNLRDRFKAEARAVAKLQHQRIVQVFEVGEHEGMPYFSLEFVEGPSLDCRLNKIPITAKEAASITEKICRAMQYAHDRGILHRDLKPANILTTPSGEPKISDFGLAKQIDDDDSAMTRTGTVMGTPSYMSPEQAQGLSDELTPQSDQYSVGAILYELLTGRAPFVGTKTYDTLSQVIHKEPVPPCHLQPGIESDIDTICLKALQKNPQKRYQNCDAMADDLARFLRGEPIHARPVGMPERFWRWCKRNPLIALPSASVVALLIVSATVSTLSFLQISAQAAVIVQERDNVEQQRDQAEQQRAVAQQNEIKAKLEEAKAVREREEAERQRILADEARLQAEKNQQLAERQASCSSKYPIGCYRS